MNPAVNMAGSIEKVSIFTWSGLLQEDMDCKVAQPNGDGSYSWTFPINDTPVNNYYFKADDIQIHVYASTDTTSNGNIIATSNYDWRKSASSGTVAYIGYYANIGFEKPTKISGATGIPGSGVPMEGLRISSTTEGVSINISVHAQISVG